MATNSTPVLTYGATIYAGGFLSAGQSFTITMNLTAAWEMQLPAGTRYGSNVSLATLFQVYPSNDGGATFDSQPLTAMALATTASVVKTASIRLKTGMYAGVFTASSPSVTVFALTQQIIDHIANA